MAEMKARYNVMPKKEVMVRWTTRMGPPSHPRRFNTHHVGKDEKGFHIDLKVFSKNPNQNKTKRFDFIPDLSWEDKADNLVFKNVQAYNLPIEEFERDNGTDEKRMIKEWNFMEREFTNAMDINETATGRRKGYIRNLNINSYVDLT
jgi:hypothetical protein